jgi:hypothetical protein
MLTCYCNATTVAKSSECKQRVIVAWILQKEKGHSIPQRLQETIKLVTVRYPGRLTYPLIQTIDASIGHTI